MLLSSHIQSEVEALYDRVTIRRAGRTVETGTLAGLRHPDPGRRSRRNWPGPPAGLDQVPGVHDLDVQDLGDRGARVRCEVDTARLDEVLRHLTAAGVRALTSQPPTLEELFLRHYSRRLRHRRFRHHGDSGHRRFRHGRFRHPAARPPPATPPGPRSPGAVAGATAPCSPGWPCAATGLRAAGLDLRADCADGLATGHSFKSLYRTLESTRSGPPMRHPQPGGSRADRPAVRYLGRRADRLEICSAPAAAAAALIEHFCRDPGTPGLGTRRWAP